MMADYVARMLATEAKAPSGDMGKIDTVIGTIFILSEMILI